MLFEFEFPAKTIFGSIWKGIMISSMSSALQWFSFENQQSPVYAVSAATTETS